MIEPLARLVNALSKLPGIGVRSATRLAYYILEQPQEQVHELANTIYRARKEIHHCSVCGNYAAQETCSICSDERRDHSAICVVRDPRDIAAMERGGAYRGQYHALFGTLSPAENRGPGDIRIRELLQRLKDERVQEVILATNADLEGEATAMYIARLLKPMGIRTTRLAQGVQAGSELEYVDDLTLSRALQGRREI